MNTSVGLIKKVAGQAAATKASAVHVQQL